ncbi:MAG: N-acetylmuramoyl-L-alanine amidase [Clostridiales bacterium]|jgi:N-acetylmuramoyl-L-alanine amidase|nr:N-acetylmuramoyl-L-alanine amidase [Clostridiales bacterium]
MLIISILSLIFLLYTCYFAPARGAAEVLTERTEVSPPSVTPSPSPTNTPSPKPIIYANVLIDPGHGGDDYGAEVESPSINEKILNMTIASRLYELLRRDSEKVRVSMTRYGETTVSRPRRVEIANETADFFISIHCNTSESSLARGISTYFQTHEGVDKPFTSEELAEVIQRTTVESTGARDRGIQYDAELYLLNHTTTPTALIEVGYLTNPEELQLLLDDDYVDLLAEGLRKGILEMADRVIASHK